MYFHCDVLYVGWDLTFIHRELIKLGKVGDAYQIVARPKERLQQKHPFRRRARDFFYLNICKCQYTIFQKFGIGKICNVFERSL